jgi:hypothetical protein
VYKKVYADKDFYHKKIEYPTSSEQMSKYFSNITISPSLLTDRPKGIVAEVQLDETRMCRHNAASQVLESGRDLRLHAPRKHVLPVRPSEFTVCGQSLTLEIKT